ncbi:MAG TPA: DEAD/DEAH box helicase [Thermoanaerobaculia bacterium]|nr:DEAD/DEAH box helicase [Thermoanaerobaculia bacterium]HQN07103.1 DEAD/DEAH box helicase [Thermoanaerobaculia bacterium]HQP84820.1 DEAD/DEAH box helicase [Thermoanaerobaculia bacterium]
MTVLRRFPPRLREAIGQRLGWPALRPVQEQAAEALLDGRNAVVLAPTAGGKTEAALFPILAGLVENEPNGVGALYVSPLRALLNNQEERFGLYTEMVGLESFVWHGDRTASRKRRFLLEPAAILMTTPESLEAMLLSQRVPVRRLFADLRAVIVDEVHSFAGTDRGAHLMSVLERIAPISGHDVQRVGLSATVGNPEAILRWLAGSSRREGQVVQPAGGRSARELLVLHREAPGDLAREASRLGRDRKVLVFCASRALTEKVAGRLRDLGTDVFVHHSSVSLEERQAAEERFRSSGPACIVATSTLELGIDVGDLDRVLQVDAPSTVSSFLQRMGRTGRRDGQTSNTTFLCQEAESVLLAVALVELAREGWVEPVPPQTRCWPVLVHQALAIALQHGGIQPGEVRALPERVPDFSGISSPEIGELTEHLVAEGYLSSAGGRLLFGERAERELGRRNFLELYAVFSTPALYHVETRARQELGTLEQSFVERLEDGKSCFVLAGRPWVVVSVAHKERRVEVEPAPRGRTPTWGGFLPQILSREVCARIRRLLTEEAEPEYLAPAARRALALLREDRGTVLAQSGMPLLPGSEAVRALTYAGGRVNYTLKAVLESLHLVRVVADNFEIRVEGSTATREAVESTLRAIAVPGYFDDAERVERLRAGLPPFRLSKFQPLLPARFAREVIGRYFLDFEGTAQFARDVVGS